ADDHAEPLALQAEAADQAVQGSGEHVLVGGVGVRLVGTSERNPVTANDRDRTRLLGGGRALRRTGFASHSSLQGLVGIFRRAPVPVRNPSTRLGAGRNRFTLNLLWSKFVVDTAPR